MTPDEIADEITDIEATLEKLIARVGAMVPAVNAVARDLNIKGMKVRACECGGIDHQMTSAVAFLGEAIRDIKGAHCMMIKKAEETPIPLPAPRSGR